MNLILKEINDIREKEWEWRAKFDSKEENFQYRESIKEFIVLLGKGDYDEEKICVAAYSIYTVICYASGLQ